MTKSAQRCDALTLDGPRCQESVTVTLLHEKRSEDVVLCAKHDRAPWNDKALTINGVNGNLHRSHQQHDFAFSVAVEYLTGEFEKHGPERTIRLIAEELVQLRATVPIRRLQAS